jgi:hypothetical protein
MRNIILIALLTSLAVVVGCQDKAPAPAEETMSSMDTESKQEAMPTEETNISMDAGTQTMENEEEKKKKDMAQSSETMDAPAATTESPATGDAAGTAQ